MNHYIDMLTGQGLLYDEFGDTYCFDQANQSLMMGAHPNGAIYQDLVYFNRFCFPSSSPLSSDSSTFMDNSHTVSSASVDPSPELKLNSATGVGKKPKDSGRKKCTNCGVTKTPSWRRSVEGSRLLCNACGL
ncbi:hypothetical protein [Absidia glauca]|uniref:GATA-type domain-containing protein n=1 Tax=Absidia glauca TaxID=4829 RepID=A0A168MEG9_ABSGL|nr:hypothetical protein [Absidia glauca]